MMRVLALLLASMLAREIYGVIMSLREPFTIRRTYALPDHVPVGGVLNAHYVFDRHFYCQTDVNRFIIIPKINEVVWRDRTVSGATAIGRDQDVLNPIWLPDSLKPGLYELHTRIYSQCPNGAHMIAAPVITFTVEGS